MTGEETCPHVWHIDPDGMVIDTYPALYSWVCDLCGGRAKASRPGPDETSLAIWPLRVSPPA